MRRGDHFAPESGDGISRLRLLPSWSVAEERPGCRSLAEAAARVEATCRAGEAVVTLVSRRAEFGAAPRAEAAAPTARVE